MTIAQAWRQFAASRKLTSSEAGLARDAFYAGAANVFEEIDTSREPIMNRLGAEIEEHEEKAFDEEAFGAATASTEGTIS